MNDPQANPKRTVLFYDGDCGFCNAAVQFVLKHEKSKEICFSALQSRYAGALFEQNRVENDLSSIIVLHEGRFHKKSEAVLALAPFLKPPYPILLKGMCLFPSFLRNGMYDLIAKNRKKWTKNPFCSLPDLADRDRFMVDVFPTDSAEQDRTGFRGPSVPSVSGYEN